MVKYIPSKGDIVHTNFSPQAGSEQAGKRFGVVLSEKKFNQSGFVFLCPITTKIKGYLLEVAIEETQHTTGVALPFHARIIDWRARGLTFVERTSQKTLQNCQNIVLKIMGRL